MLGHVIWTRRMAAVCRCGGYHFPHRKGGGACDHSKTMVYHRSRRQGDDHLEAMIEQALMAPRSGSVECPF